MHHKVTPESPGSQARIGRVVLKSGAAILPVSVQDGGAWRVNGLLRITPADIGLRAFPTTRRERGRFIGQAIRAARRALEGAGA